MVEEEVDPFGNYLFLSLARHVVTMQENICSSITPRGPQEIRRTTTLTIRNLALDYILEHKPTFKDSFARKTTTTANASSEGTAPEDNALDSALDSDLDQYYFRMRSEVAQEDELTIRAAALALHTDIRILKLNPTTGTVQTITYPAPKNVFVHLY
jgi:hypothetical protein